MSLVNRVKGLILTPDKEWSVIETEPVSIKGLYRHYIVFLAAIPPFATFLSVWLFGFSRGRLGEAHVAFASGLLRAVVQYGLSLPLIFMVAFVISMVAPSFEGRSDDTKALALAAYSFTPAWLAGIFALIPGLRWLDILGLYGIYLFYLGAPRLLKCPKDHLDVLTLVALFVTIATGALHAYVVRLIAPLSA